MLRTTVYMAITVYFDDLEKVNKIQEDFDNTLAIIEGIYAKEWCLEPIERTIEEIVLSGKRYRMIMSYETSKNTLSLIIEHFDEVERNNNVTYLLDFDDPTKKIL